MPKKKRQRVVAGRCLAMRLFEKRKESSRAVRRLREHLEATGGSLTSLAEKIGCTRSNVSVLFAGDSLPSLHLAVTIEREFGVPCAEWFE